MITIKCNEEAWNLIRAYNKNLKVTSFKDGIVSFSIKKEPNLKLQRGVFYLILFLTGFAIGYLGTLELGEKIQPNIISNI